MNKVKTYVSHPAYLALGAFLAAWSNADFALDYKSVLFAILAGNFGYATPKKK